MPELYNDKSAQIGLFFEQLGRGEGFEKDVINLLKLAGHQAWKSDDRDYDLNILLSVPLFGDFKVTGECKLDERAESTGNLALGVMSFGKPSGINRRGANPDLWFHGVAGEVWIMKTEAIRNLCHIHRKTWGHRRVKCGCNEAIMMPITVARKAVGGTWVSL